MPANLLEQYYNKIINNELSDTDLLNAKGQLEHQEHEDLKRFEFVLNGVIAYIDTHPDAIPSLCPDHPTHSEYREILKKKMIEQRSFCLDVCQRFNDKIAALLFILDSNPFYKTHLYQTKKFDTSLMELQTVFQGLVLNNIQDLNVGQFDYFVMEGIYVLTRMSRDLVGYDDTMFTGIPTRAFHWQSYTSFKINRERNAPLDYELVKKTQTILFQLRALIHGKNSALRLESTDKGRIDLNQRPMFSMRTVFFGKTSQGPVVQDPVVTHRSLLFSGSTSSGEQSNSALFLAKYYLSLGKKVLTLNDEFDSDIQFEARNKFIQSGVYLEHFLNLSFRQEYTVMSQLKLNEVRDRIYEYKYKDIHGSHSQIEFSNFNLPLQFYENILEKLRHEFSVDDLIRIRSTIVELSLLKDHVSGHLELSREQYNQIAGNYPYFIAKEICEMMGLKKLNSDFSRFYLQDQPLIKEEILECLVRSYQFTHTMPLNERSTFRYELRGMIKDVEALPVTKKDLERFVNLQITKEFQWFRWAIYNGGKPAIAPPTCSSSLPELDSELSEFVLLSTSPQ
ncbi:hypothetical protein [Legionella quinlivanii]|uniref:hypothetical protein n=1 Tax=Legionella quinlivanii TaxID=45073 RepID=UPI00224419B1|nr:hypothetical protein [Legionella quinlivanii]MCW8450328.1 hypothetical protein [Legionella quinlivanii]